MSLLGVLCRLFQKLLTVHRCFKCAFCYRPCSRMWQLAHACMEPSRLLDLVCLCFRVWPSTCMVPGRQAEPDDARLLCALGDLTVDDACYERAWTASGGRSVRAKRCLARSAQRRQDFATVRRPQDVVGFRREKRSAGLAAPLQCVSRAEQLTKVRDALRVKNTLFEPFDYDRSPHVVRHGEVAMCKQCDKCKDTA